ncbi:MAG: hypothetical protein J6I60_01250 [Bacteroidaceae bacterium]|nr:hypothetical protein [Bacteroidaceae bacterium]
MAKKDPNDYTVEERLKLLYQLQTNLSAIDEKKAIRGELPLEVQDLEDEIAGLNTRQQKIGDEMQAINDAVQQKHADIDKAKASIARYTKQLDDVKNSREYDTLTKEIEYQNLEVELCEKKIREAGAVLESKEQEKKDTEQLIADREDHLKEKKNELDEIMQETREDEAKLAKKVADIEAKVEDRLLNSFHRIRHNARNGLGIVVVQRDACGGCFNKIPPQRQLDIKMHKKIIVCEYCGRILIDPELAGVKIAAKEEKTKRRKTAAKATSKQGDE